MKNAENTADNAMTEDMKQKIISEINVKLTPLLVEEMSPITNVLSSLISNLFSENIDLRIKIAILQRKYDSVLRKDSN